MIKPLMDTIPAGPCTGTQASAFFTLLPFELRREILVHAFGNRILHTNSLRLAEGNEVSRHPTEDNPRDRQRPLFSHACPQDGGVSDPELGVTAWLLTCRQAFTEGIDVAYSCNTIHIRDYHSHGIEHLARRLPPLHFSMIRSIDWIRPDLWLWPEERDSKRNRHEEDLVRTAIAQLAASLPNLKRLYIAFNPSLHNRFGRFLTPTIWYREYRDRMLPLMDSLFEEHGQGWDEIELGAPVSFYHAYRTMYREPHLRILAEGWESLYQESPVSKGCPLPGDHVRERVFRSTSASTGYWISRIGNDMKGVELDPALGDGVWWDDDAEQYFA